MAEPLEELANERSTIPEPVRPVEPKIEIDDGTFEAHRRRQASWEQDAKEIFRGPSEDERRRAKLLADLDEINARNRAELMKAEAIKREAAERETAKARAAELRERAKTLRAEAKDADAEATRLEKLVKE